MRNLVLAALCAAFVPVAASAQFALVKISDEPVNRQEQVLVLKVASTCQAQARSAPDLKRLPRAMRAKRIEARYRNCLTMATVKNHGLLEFVPRA